MDCACSEVYSELKHTGNTLTDFVFLRYDNIVVSFVSDHTCVHKLISKNIHLSTILNESVKW
jgi:hypothetical protein